MNKMEKTRIIIGSIALVLSIIATSIILSGCTTKHKITNNNDLPTDNTSYYYIDNNNYTNYTSEYKEVTECKKSKLVFNYTYKTVRVPCKYFDNETRQTRIQYDCFKNEEQQVGFTSHEECIEWNTKLVKI